MWRKGGVRLGWPIKVASVAILASVSILDFDARSSLRTVIDQVVEDADVTAISRCDAPDAVVMSFDYYSSLMETNAAHLATSIAQARAGQAQPREIVETPEAGDQKNAKPEVHG